MPTVAENKQQWNDYSWKDGGHEWSTHWGTAADQWFTTILCRIFPLLPAHRILEIGPGFGRWTPYLIGNCREYIGTDISERCIAHCRRTFGPLPSAPRFILGDGMSLKDVRNNSISLAFSFDSLVHAELDCLTAYADELARVLVPGGHAFLHHSNLGEYMVDEQLTVPQVGWRGRTVSAERIRNTFSARGFVSIIHEKIKWIYGDGPFCDCFTLVKKVPMNGYSREELREPVFYNDRFSEELVWARFISERYTSGLTQSLDTHD